MKIEAKTFDTVPGLVFSKTTSSGIRLEYVVSDVFQIAGVWCVRYFRLKRNGHTFGCRRAMPFSSLEKGYIIKGVR